jgi:hypothetical protein
MPNGEITHFGCASPSYLADGTVLFNAVILDVTKKPLMSTSRAVQLERSNEELEQFAFVALMIYRNHSE